MMTREHHRRRSPESSRRRRKERRDSREQLQNQQIALPAPPPEERNELITYRSRAPSPLSSSSSTSSSLVNISRPSRRFGLGAFFGGGSGSGRKQHRVKKKRSRFLRFGNSSSSSVGSDLAYGKGYVERRRSREISPPSSSAGRPRPRRDQTDEEILELGRQFAEIARKQNAEDLKAAGRSRPSALVGAATALSQFRRTNSGNSNKGVGSSKPRLDDSSDDSEWESASEDESSSSEFDSGLAYGSSGLSLPNTINHPIPSQSTPSSSRSPLPSQIYGPPLRRKSSVVDPRLFGPVNSLHGFVDAPCGFETIDRSTIVGSPRPYEPSRSPSEAVTTNRPLQLVYPVATSDPSRVDYDRGSVVSSQQDLSNLSRPAPVPLQQPRPIAPVSISVFESVETESKKTERASSKKVPESTATTDSAAGASESVSLSSGRKYDHDQHDRNHDRHVTRPSKRSDASVQAEKDEKRKSRHDSPPVARDNPAETRGRPLFGSDPKSERDSNWEKVVPEIKQKFENEWRRRDEHGTDVYDYDPPRNKHKHTQQDGLKTGDREAHQEERRNGDRVSRSGVESYKPVNGPENPTRKAPIDIFQFQVADDAFSTPPYTTSKRPLTPNVITVDREPNFSSPEDHSSPERLSRRDSYERQLHDAVEIYEAAEHATAPVSEVAFAAAAATVMAEDRRGHSHEKDVVQENANRYYREVELARKIKDAETRDAGTSVVGKWKEDQQPTIVDVVSPPEMDHPKKKSPYDGPDADVRIDNILEHPKELSRFLVPDIKSHTKVPIFTARDPSAERERPMLNVVRPTPIPTPIPIPIPEEQRRPEEPLPKPVKKIDILPPKVVPAVVTESQSEAAVAPSGAKSVSWGKNQTKRYVVESPERGDDPYSGTKIVMPAETPKSRTGKRSGWGLGFIAATLGGGSNKKASSSTPEQIASVEATELRKASRNEDEPPNRRASVPFKSTYDSPPVPGPKPSNLKGARKSGSFQEDPAFTANIAAALESSGFDPKIVIDDANFHKRDSPPGSDDFGAYRTPFVESVTDLGIFDTQKTAASQSDRERGFVVGEVDTPSEERDIPTDKSRILSELNRAEQRKQDKAPDRGGVEKPELIADNSKAAELSRSFTEDEWDVPSSKLSKKVGKRREKATRVQSSDDTLVDKTPRNEQELKAEFIVEGEDTSSKRRPNKTKKPVVVQEDSRQSDTVESSDIPVPVDVSHIVRDINAVQLGTSGRLDENNKGFIRDLEKYSSPSISTAKPEASTHESKEPVKVDDVFFTPDGESGISRKDNRRSRPDLGESFSRTVLPTELSTASSYGIVDTADSIISTDDEWEIPKKSEGGLKRDNGAYNSPLHSVPKSEASPDRAQKVNLASLPGSDDSLRKGKKSKRGSVDDTFAFPAVRGVEDWDSPNKLQNESTQDSSVRDSSSQAEPPVEYLYDSPKEMTESSSDVRSEKTAATEDELDMARKAKKSTRSSISYEDQPSTYQSAAPFEGSVETSKRSKPDSYPNPSKILDRDASPAVSNQSRHDDNQTADNYRRDEKVDDTKTITSTSKSAGKKSRKGSKSEGDKKGSGSTSFFGRLKSSIGIAEEKQHLPKVDEDKNDPFLGNADIPGVGVGSMGDVTVSQESQSKATSAPVDEKAQINPSTPERQSTLPRQVEPIDPEIVPREFRPAIDPKHGDLLPLPPSRPRSPISKLGDNFPPLPDSRPETPEHERHVRETPTHTRRRSTLETPKTPSQSAIPIQFFRPGHRHTPSNGRSSPSISPVTATVEFGGESKNRSRPTSWEASRDFKPLLLLQKALRGSVDLSSSPEREYLPSEVEIRERGSPSSAPVFMESPDRGHPFRENIFSKPLSSPVGIPVEKPESSHAAERAYQLGESPFSKPLNEASSQRDTRAEGSHLSPLPEEADLKAGEDSRSPFSSPALPVAPGDGAQGNSAKGLKDNLDDTAIPKGVATPDIREPETTTTPDNHTSSQATKAVTMETPQEFLPASDLLSGTKTPDSTDTFDTALSNADDRGLPEYNVSIDKARDNDQLQQRTLSYIDELSVHPAIETTPLQGEHISGVVHERISPAEHVEPTPVDISTKGIPEAPEQDVDDNESIETVLPEYSISEPRREQPSIDVQEELPTDQVDDEVPVDSNRTPIEQPTLVEEKPVAVEELKSSHEKPITRGSEAAKVEINNPRIELRAEPQPEATSEPSPIPLESSVVEKSNAPENEVALLPEVPPVEIGTPSIEPERSVVEPKAPMNDLETSSTGPRMASELGVSSREPKVVEIESHAGETHVEEPITSAVQKDIPVTEDEPIEVESEAPSTGLGPVVKPESTISQSDPATIGRETSTFQTEPVVTERESAPIATGLEKPEQLAPVPELSSNPSNEHETKGEGAQQPVSENEQTEHTSPVEKQAKRVEELTQETNADSHHAFPVDQQTSGQDRAETTPQELRDNQLKLPEQTLLPVETSEEEGQKMQVIAPEPKVRAVDEQIPAREEESQPVSQSPPLPAIQTEDQQPNTPAEGSVEAPTSPQAKQQLNLFPVNELTSEPVLEEPKRSSEADYNDEETSREIPTLMQPVEPILSNPKIDSHDDLQSTLPALGQDEQSQSISNPSSEEVESPSDTTKPKGSIADGEHDVRPSLAETGLPQPAEQKPSGLALLEDTNVDESPMQLDSLGGEDSRDQQGPASTDPLEALSSSPNWNESSEKKQDKSPVSPQAAEEPSGLSLETDNARPPSLINEVSGEEARETTQPQDEPSNKKRESKEVEISQATSKIVDTSKTIVPYPEPAAQEAPLEADAHEPQTVSDIPEKPPQDRDIESAAPIVEEQSTIPQPIIEDMQEPVVAQAEPIDDDVSPGLDSSGKESQEKSEEGRLSQLGTTDAIDAPALGGELESERSVGEPAIVEIEADSKPSSQPLAHEVDLTAVTEVENQASESQSIPNKEEVEAKRGSNQIETITNDTPQETPEILDARDDASKEVTPLTQFNVGRLSDDTQATQAKGDTDGPTTINQLETDNKSENASVNTSETPASIILPEISTKPDFNSEDIIQAGRNFGLDPTPSGIERPEKEKLEGAQLPGALKRGSMEVPMEPVGDTPTPDTTFNPDWSSIEIPPLPDFLSKSEDQPHDASEVQQEQSHDQPVDPLDQLIQHIEAKARSEVPSYIQGRPTSGEIDASASAEQPIPQKADEESIEARNRLLVDNRSNDGLGSVQEPLGEVVPAVQEPVNDNIPAEVDNVQEPPTQDESQALPIPATPRTPLAEATPTAVPEPQERIEQPVENMTNDSNLATSRVAPPISEDGQSNLLTEHAAISDSQVESSLLTENITQATLNVLPTITEELESEGQDALDTQAGAAAPVDEPSTEVPPSDLVETPSTIPQDQTNLGEVTPEVPTIVEPEELVSQPHRYDPQSPTNEDKGIEKESQVQEHEPEASPLPTEPTTEQPQTPILKSKPPQDVMPLDLPLVKETKTEPRLTEQNAPDLPDLPTPGTSKTAVSMLDISPSPTREPEPRPSDVTGTTREPEPRPSDVTGTTVHSQDSGQEPGVNTDKAGDDVLITRPEIAPSGEVTNVQDQEKTRQTNDLTENSMLEEEPVAEPVRDDEGDEGVESVLTPRPKERKEIEERGSQSFLDDMASVPSQESAESVPSMPEAVDEAINSAKTSVPIVSEELSLPPPDKVDEPTETAIAAAQEDISSSPTHNQFTAADVEEIVEPEPKNPESVEDKEGEENKLTLLDNHLSEKVLEQEAEGGPTAPIGEDESQVLAPTEASEEEALDEPISPKKSKKGKKAKRRNAHDENASQVEPGQASVDTIGNDEQMESGTSQSHKDADVIDLGPTGNKEDVEVKDVVRSDDVQSQEQNQAKLESAAQPDISEMTETENLAVESLKDETIDEVVPTKKAKKNKKKKRASPRGEETISQQELSQPTTDLMATTSAVDQVNTELFSIPENSASYDVVDLKLDHNADKEKQPSAQEPELEAKMPTEPESGSTPQQLESSMDLSSTDVAPMNTEDPVPIEENHLTRLLEVPAGSTAIEATVANIQDDRPSTEDGISAMAPLETAQEQVETITLPDSNIPLTDQTPTEDTDIVPPSDEPNTEGSAQAEAVLPETLINQELEEQTDVLSSSPREELVPQELVHSDEKREEAVDPIISETPAEAVHPEELSRSREYLQPAESTQVEEVAMSGEHTQTENLPTEELVQPEEPTTSEEQLEQAPPKVEELAQPGEPEQLVPSPEDPLETDEPAQQEPAELEPVEPEPIKPEPVQPESVEPEPVQSKTVEPELVQPGPVQPDESSQRLEQKLLTQAQEPTRLASSANPVEESTITSDEAESTPTKMPKKSKEKKKAIQVELEPEPEQEQAQEPAEASTQIVEPQIPEELPKRSAEQPVDQRAEQRMSWGFFGGFADSFKSLLSIQEPTTSKNDENTEDPFKSLTKSKPETEDKGTIQLETAPTPKSVLSLEREGRPSWLESLQESQQFDTDNTSAAATDPMPEDVLSEVAISKESKKKDKEVSQASEEPELKTEIPLEPQAQPVLFEESPVQEIQGRTDALPIVEQPPITKGEKKRKADLSQSPGSKMSKKERRKMKKLAALAAELFQTEPDLKVSNEQVAPKTAPGPSEQTLEPANPDSEVKNDSITSSIDTTSSNTPEADLQTPVIETASSIQPIQERTEGQTEEKGENIGALLGQEENLISSSEQALIAPEVENTTKDAPANRTADVIGEATPDVQESKGISPDIPIETSEKGEEAQTLSTPEINIEIPNSDPQPQSLPDTEKEDETTVSTGTSVNVEQSPRKSNEVPERIKTPKISTAKHLDLPAYQQFDTDPSPSSPLSRKKSRKDKKKKRLSAQAGSEVSSETQTPASQEQNTGKDSSDITKEPNVSELERTMVNEVSEITQPPWLVSERDSDTGPLSETRQDTLEHVELPGPVTPPRTPSTVSAYAVNVDLSPAQLSSHVEHERPFDQSPQPGKRIRTRLSSSNATTGLFSTRPKSSQGTESSGYEARGLLPPVGLYTTKSSDNDVASHGIIPAQGSAASYLEPQLIPTTAIPHNVEANSGVKQISTPGLLPVLAPRREIAASYSAAQPSSDNILTDATQKLVGDASPVAISHDISTLPLEPQLSRSESKRKEERALPIQPEARQRSHIEDMNTPARKIAAILMEAHLNSSKKNKEMLKDVDPTVPERIATTSSTGEATHSTEKYASMKTPDTQDILDNRAVPKVLKSEVLEEKHMNVNASDMEAERNTGAVIQTEIPSSKLKDIPLTRGLPVQGSAAEEDTESPVVGGQVQQSLPEPRTPIHGSPTLREPPTTEIIKRLDDLDTSEHAREPSVSTLERKIDEVSPKPPSSRSLIQDYGNTGRNSPRILPPVKEETREELQDEGGNRGHNITRKSPIVTELNRDSGFVTDSPNSIRRSSWDDLSQRDSAVHLRDWPENPPTPTPTRRKTGLLENESSEIRTRQPNERRSKKLGLGNEAPKLSTPIARSQDEMQDGMEPRKTRLAKSQDDGKRSVSESISRGSTPGIENHQPRRSASNTSISRLRTPEPQQFRPESPGGRNFRSGSNTPPLALRRIGKRMSGYDRRI
ncbi:uncharacterized protein F4812DRAFT_64046 [Daldinia caldariorum]|uniref:uncharacterized protein n=1 Tax=Daldinia caldariorum TaxID=326644 RepID=UPI002008B4F0|nr:uncharacterized protein F4812DRAFT_64046 [Daldinia caldariorum]KAI1466732.1 hypothetical protein F4812DRAFT_64046 [Daldinia caldariorum]